MTKVGITALERGSARLLEQGAVAFSWLGVGPLMAARRTEELLRTALGVPDRIPYADKRAVRAALPGSAAERAVEVEELHARAVGLGGWPESLERASCQVVDHVGAFGLAGPTGPAPAVGAVSELVAGGVVGGELVAAAGPDLHLAVEDGRGKGEEMRMGMGRDDDGRVVVVLDTRLMSGWELVPVGSGGLTVPVREFKAAKGSASESAGVQDGLF